MINRRLHALSAPLIAAIVALVFADAASAQARSLIADLPVFEGSSACQWAEGDHIICRRITGTSATTALQYPLFLRTQGWFETGRGSTSDSMHANAIFFERAIDDTCSERVSMELAPAAPGSENTMPAILIRTDYEPVCGADRGAQ